MEDQEKGENSKQLPTNTGEKSSPLTFDALFDDDQKSRGSGSSVSLNIPSVPTPAPFDPNLFDFEGNGIDAENKNGDITAANGIDAKNKNGDITAALLGSEGETAAEDVPLTFREEETNVPYSTLFDPGPSTSRGVDISAHQQTTSGAEDISAYQQTTSGAEDISAYQLTSSGAEDVQYPQEKIKTAHCGACGEMLEDTEEELSNHNCSEAKCEHCDTPVIFKDYSDFVQHSESAHQDTYTFHCPYCIVDLHPSCQFDNMNFKNHESYTDEIGRKQLCGKGKYFKCYECNDGTIVFKYYKDFEVHKILYHLHHKKLPKRQCGICQEIFPTCLALMNHGVEKHGTKNVLQCPYCGLYFHQVHSLAPHLKKDREEREQQIIEGRLKTHPCPYCTKDFASELFLRNHAKKVHNEEISYPCTECKETFPYSINVEEHKQESLSCKPKMPRETP